MYVYLSIIIIKLYISDYVKMISTLGNKPTPNQMGKKKNIILLNFFYSEELES